MKVEPFRLGSESALASSSTACSELLLMSAELLSKRISRSIFGLVAAISAISWRSSNESDRVLRLRTKLRKLTSFICLAVSTCGAAIERPRVGDVGLSARTILSADTVSPAKAMPTVIDSAAPSVTMESKRVIVVILNVTPARLAAWRFDAVNIGQVQIDECDLRHFQWVA